MAPNLKKLLDDLEERIEALKILYEQYFMGLEKLEPLKERQGVARIVRRAQSQQTKNTAARFRLNSLNQRFISYQSYWNRITRQIEAGTYHRDLARVERDMKRRGINVDGLSKLRSKGELEAALVQGLAEATEPTPAAEAAPASDRQVREFSPEEKLGMLTGEYRIASTRKPPPVPGNSAAPPPVPGNSAASRPVPGNSAAPPPIPGRATAAPPVAGTPPPVPAVARRAASAGGEDRMKRLYNDYVGARQRTGESTDGLTYERLKRTLQKQVPSIQAKTGCRRVDFKVEIKQGKAVVKAVPVK